VQPRYDANLVLSVVSSISSSMCIEIPENPLHYTMIIIPSLKIITTFDWLKPRDPGYKKNIFTGVARPYYLV
jgi:hypothetical protein